MQKLAIIGTGVAGLGCAYFLQERFDLTLFEQNDYPGGHTNTIEVFQENRTVPIDTGFMVYNEVTYPNLTRLFAGLGVETQPAAMSFSVQYRPSNLEFSGSSLNHLFAQRRNIFNPRFIKMLLSVNRFNGEAAAALQDPKYETYTVGEYVREKKYGDDFLNRYLVPMSSAVWSTPPGSMLEFPALTMLRFFHNHGFLGLHTQHPWRTVTRGTKSYVSKMISGFKDRIRLNTPVRSVHRAGSQVEIEVRGGAKMNFDKVIFAAHADQSLKMLHDPTPMEQALLSPFKYQYNKAVLHRDDKVMPRTKLAWSSWNYSVENNESGALEPSVHYWMNGLQGIPRSADYFVSLNSGRINPDKVIKVIDYEHPLLNLQAVRAQQDLSRLNRIGEDQMVYFCGSYFKYGFHEDAFTSALELSRVILKESIWKS